MPVKGLTDRKSIEARYPILGKLRKGDKKRANRPGEDLSHFRFTGEGPRFEEIERIFVYQDRLRCLRELQDNGVYKVGSNSLAVLKQDIVEDREGRFPGDHRRQQADDLPES